MIAYEIASLIERHMSENYKCYGFACDVSRESQCAPICTAGYSIQHQHIQTSITTTIRLRLIQYFDPHDIPTHSGFFDIRSSTDPFVVVMRKYVMDWKLDKRPADTNRGYEMLSVSTLKLGDDEHCQQVFTELKNATWDDYSKQFDAEIDKTLKSE